MLPSRTVATVATVSIDGNMGLARVRACARACDQYRNIATVVTVSSFDPCFYWVFYRRRLRFHRYGCATVRYGKKSLDYLARGDFEANSLVKRLIVSSAPARDAINCCC
jgi:hypothetical protein